MQSEWQTPCLTLVPLPCSDELEHEMLLQRSVAPDDVVSADYRWGGIGHLERRFAATRSTTGAHTSDLSRCMQARAQLGCMLCGNATWTGPRVRRFQVADSGAMQHIMVLCQLR